MIALSFLLSCTVCGQVAPAPAAGDSLAEPYVDGTFGFSVRPPKGWQVVRQRVPERDGVILLQMSAMVSPTMTQEIVLKQTSVKQKTSLDEMLKRVSDAQELEFNDRTVLSQQTQQIAGRPGAVLVSSYFREGVKRMRIEAIIEYQPQLFYLLVYNGPLQLRRTSEPLFYSVLGSMRFLTEQVDEGQMKAALEAGVSFLASLNEGRLKAAIVPEEYLKIETGGRTAGFIAVYQSDMVWERHSGVRIRERGWTFEGDERARRLQNSMFISFDLKYERWRTSITTLVPATANRPEYLEVALEEGLRTDNVLLTNQSYSMDAPAVANPALSVPPSYISRAIIRMLPRLTGDPAEKKKLGCDVRSRSAMVRGVTSSAKQRPGSGFGGVFRLGRS
jgi:hypothetical protein